MTNELMDEFGNVVVSHMLDALEDVDDDSRRQARAENKRTEKGHVTYVQTSIIKYAYCVTRNFGNDFSSNGFVSYVDLVAGWDVRS